MALLSIILLVTVTVTAIACKLYFAYINFYQYIERLPGKSWLPIFGNALDFAHGKVESFNVLLQYWRDLGYNIFRVYICWQPQIVLSHPDDVEKILSSNMLIDKMVDYRFIRPWLGDGLLTSTGAKWQRHRKIITPAFHFKKLVNFLVTINSNTNNFITYLNEHHADGVDFDVQRPVHLETLDIICETAIGVKVNALYNSNSDIVRSIHNISDVLMKRYLSAWKRFDFLFQFSHDSKTQKQALETLNTFAQGVIVKRRKYLAEKDSNELNDNEMEVFVDILLRATVNNRALTDREIMDEVSTVIFGGHDTTAAAITFSIYMLSQHLTLQEELYQEQLTIFNGDRHCDSSYNEINEMKQLELFIKETLRIYPSVPIIARHVFEGFDLNGKYIPSGSEVGIFILGVGRNPNVYENPEVFDPSRFTVENRLHRSLYDFLPFSAGPRNCLGQKFAMLIIKTVLSKLLRNFRVELPDDKLFKPQLTCCLTLNSDNGILIKLRKRQ